MPAGKFIRSGEGNVGILDKKSIMAVFFKMSDRLVAFGRLLLTTEKRFLSLVSVLSGKLQIPAVKAEIVASAYIIACNLEICCFVPAARTAAVAGFVL